MDSLDKITLPCNLNFEISQSNSVLIFNLFFFNITRSSFLSKGRSMALNVNRPSLSGMTSHWIHTCSCTNMSKVHLWAGQWNMFYHIRNLYEIFCTIYTFQFSLYVTFVKSLITLYAHANNGDCTRHMLTNSNLDCFQTTLLMGLLFTAKEVD